MSTKSLSDLISEIRFRGNYRNSVRFPDANITTEVQATFAEFYELIADTNEGYWDTIGSLSTVAGTAFVALPSDAWRVRKLSRLDSNEYVPMDQIGIDDIDDFSSSSRGKPSAFRLTARGIDLYLTPDAIYTLRLIYTPLAPTLGTAREFYNGWDEFVKWGTLVKLRLNEQRDASEFQQQLDIQRARITRGASQRKAQEPEYIPLREGYWSDLDRDQRWR